MKLDKNKCHSAISLLSEQWIFNEYYVAMNMPE